MNNLELINELAEHEAEAWKAHHLKNSQRLAEEMASLYEKLYNVNFKDGLRAGAYTVKAAWLHDLAEELGDVGQIEKSEAYWEETKENLIEHYKILLNGIYNNKEIKPSVNEMKIKAETIALHDVTRWRVHHERDYNKIAHEMSKIYELLLNIKYEKAFRAVLYALEALKLHDIAEKYEDIHDEINAEKFWNKVKDKLRMHFKLLVENN